jgi:hypothetical protein
LTLSQLGEGTLMRYLLLPFTPRYILLTIALLGTLALAAIAALDPETLPALSLPLAILGGLLLLGICDLIQTRHAILRNYPIAAASSSSISGLPFFSIRARGTTASVCGLKTFD